MKKFRFRLQRLLEIARRREEAARREAGNALQDLRRLEEAVAQGEETLREAQAFVRQSITQGSARPGLLEGLQLSLARTEARLCIQKTDCVLGEARYEECRQQMASQRRELLVLEKAREKALEAWRDEAQREELALMEEAALIRYRRGAQSR
ncbi:MAG: hypothetical protein KDB53_18815 [Planctomycetes bacterium]|nr:hypothetical protein [Planctomycetota bacterium]